ncbi:ABC transporter ATP-binding protein [Enterococcus saigonensis]|uniref:ABC transporter ATP-binding protein n=1 Tax=Enterococcus saigonensis TaxID=1805431 RepID=A0A679ICY6_9ENTE|nr:ABC transporter ATP-binding protein [Enterococcus saigonensis]BCA86079.1 ABC transporter ATP-binding protein [Enterococcus saigonensis]
MTAMLTLQNITKQFGNHLVLDDLNLTIPRGSIFGFVGENGAGKTTTMKIILGLLAADSGSVTIAGQTVKYGNTKTNQKVGYLPDVPTFYDYLTAKEYLTLCGRTSGMTKSQQTLQIPALLSKVGLQTTQKIGKFSRGMKQRLGLAQALLNEPQLLICDEPTSALDPSGRKEVLQILASLKNETTVLFSSHILTDVEAICDYVAILNDGKIHLTGSLAEIKNSQPHHYELHFENPNDTALFLNQNPLTWQQVEKKLILPSEEPTNIGLQIIKRLATLNLVPLEFKLVEPTLEDIFLKAVKK